MILAVLAFVTTASLRGLCVVNDDVVWASGTGGTVIRTTNGGKTWQSFTIDLALDIRDIHSFDAKTAVAMATAGRIYRTRDGGMSWELVWIQEQAFLDSIDFRDAQHGFAVGDPIGGRFVLLETRDGGATWRSLVGPPARENEAAFAASGTCIVAQRDELWIATSGARVLHRRNGGWESIPFPMPTGNDSSGIFGLAVRDRHVYAVGGDYKRPDDVVDSVARDGTRLAKMAFRSAIALHDRMVIVTGTSGTDISRNHGRTWTRIGDGYNAVACGKQRCFVVGRDGAIAAITPGATPSLREIAARQVSPSVR